ncbi:MAG: HD domain-containing protein [Treponema sp.]|nr:HD domain-containing protein [Candidatus Treponema merdequi]
MKKIIKIDLIVSLLLFVFTFNIFSEPAVDRAFDYLNKNLQTQDYEKAFTYSLFLINYFETEKMPSMYEKTVKTAVIRYADFLVEKEQWNSIYTLLEDTKVAPPSVFEAVKSYVIIADKHIKESDEKARLENKEYTEQITKMINEINENNSKAIKSVSDNNFKIAFIFSIILFVFLIAIIVIIFLLIKTTKQNQIQLQNTILAMQAMSFSTPSNKPVPLRLKSDNSEEPESDFSNLLLVCKKYGDQIDSITTRRNLSNRVAELVYKISIKLGYSDTEAMVFYAACLIYDIGFLKIDPSILKARTLSEEQFELIKTHTVIALKMLSFVDQKYQNVFKDAVSKHHENLDGSGYPNGIKGQKIPYIARVIHVVESYLALISSREYKEISDRNEAISELRSASRQYDQKIVDALDLIV